MERPKERMQDAWHREQNTPYQGNGAHTLFTSLFLMVYEYKGEVGDIYFVISSRYDEN